MWIEARLTLAAYGLNDPTTIGFFDWAGTPNRIGIMTYYRL